MGKGCLTVLLFPVIAVVLAFVLILMVTLGSPGSAVANGVCGTAGTPGTVPAGTKKVGDFSGDQLQNAADIMSAASDLDLPVAAQILGAQAAIGESTLTVIDHGDVAGPDSRGLFQQRAAGWGSSADRMDPHTSATNFFKAMQQVEGWQELTPTIAIHRTQRNADENHYTKYRTQAVAVVKALSRARMTRTTPRPSPPLTTMGPAPPGTAKPSGIWDPAIGSIPCRAHIRPAASVADPARRGPRATRTPPITRALISPLVAARTCWHQRT